MSINESIRQTKTSRMNLDSWYCRRRSCSNICRIQTSWISDKRYIFNWIG